MRPHLTIRSLLALSLCMSVTAGAQAGIRAPGWKVVFDRAGIPDSAANMGAMAPGWHVSTLPGAPGAITFDPANVGARTFQLESEMIFFGSASGAGAGLVIAGRGLDTPGPRFVAFTVYPDGRYAVIRMTGATRETLVIPTTDAAIARHPGGNVQVKHVLSLEGDDRTVTFKVNGTRVASLPRAVVDPGGVVGLRLEPGVNVHIATFLLDGKNAAPVPTR